ncbi:MAG: 2-polyprenyl-6-methoxyphenol hydroxylase-like FAD-dependent oxidoreductase [Kiritimatiellia bacterium]|jgi:2-polyprenyl-6-methoxyphenol hydroxylase-like FAD-dependent oxidoreductase
MKTAPLFNPIQRGIAGIAWLLLMKSMADAQRSLQTGFLGWWAVFRGRKPVYKTFSSTGLYKHARQRIYLSFSLILWAAGTWTPDQLFIAAIWTSYCFAGVRLKDRRMARFNGVAYHAYQQRAPFWRPRLLRNRHQALEQSQEAVDYDVCITGAGPIGLLCANLLGAQGVKVLVIEKRAQAPEQSMAIGITPPSLKILQAVGLDQVFTQQGVPIRSAHVHTGKGLLGRLDFSDIPSAFPYILSLPQSETIRLLRDRLKACPNVELRYRAELIGLEQHPGAVTLTIQHQGEREQRSAAFMIGCDGAKGITRKLIQMPTVQKQYRPRFLMADYPDHTDLGPRAHLFFTSRGSVESFPLPGQKRRWIVLARREESDERIQLARQVETLAGISLTELTPDFESAFRAQRHCARSFFRGRVLLCGDAAHTMSPIGGQGMNTGFADVELLAQILPRLLADPGEAGSLLPVYDRVRRKAFNVAANRAARGMWLGTRTGYLLSALREKLIHDLLAHPGRNRKVSAYFAMLTIPYRSASLVQMPTTKSNRQKP